MNFWLMLGFQCITCFSLGACFTWLTKKSGSLFPAAIAHAVNNNAAGLLAIFFTTEAIQKQHPDSLMLLDSLAILIFGIIAFVLLITDAKNNGRKR